MTRHSRMDVFAPHKPCVMVIDDQQRDRTVLDQLLNHAYQLRWADSCSAALTMCQQDPPDLILLDFHLSEMDDRAFCRQLKADACTYLIPIILLVSRFYAGLESHVADLGAVDYIKRPVSPRLLLSRLRAHFADASYARMLRINNEYLEYEALKRARQLMEVQHTTLLSLAALAETRDEDTGNHLKRTQHYVRILGCWLRDHSRWSHELNEELIDTWFKCAPLHDIGKVGIPDHILLKPGRYSAEEFEIMKRHPTLGRNALAHAHGQPDSHDKPHFLQIAEEIVYCHHEKWDGSGYPQGLKGEAIPLAARAMAVADVYDALISRRVYKSGMSHQAAFDIVTRGSGTHFDPEVVAAFRAASRDFQDVAERFADSDTDLLHKQQAFADHHPH